MPTNLHEDGQVYSEARLSKKKREQLLMQELDGSVIDLVQNQTALTPNAIAVVCGRESLSYSELNGQANRIARLLESRGVHEGTFVSLCLPRSIEQAVAILAILKAGAAYVPLDPAYPAERLAFMLQDCGARVLLTQNSLADALPTHPIDTIRLDALQDKIKDSGAEPRARPTGGSPAYVIYTSGSTGKPKGIVMPHRPLVNLLKWQCDVLPEPARTIQFAPASFDVSFQEIFSTWSTGGTLVIIDEMLRRDPARLWSFIVQEEITRLFLPFVALQTLAETVSGPSALCGNGKGGARPDYGKTRRRAGKLARIGFWHWHEIIIRSIRASSLP